MALRPATLTGLDQISLAYADWFGRRQIEDHNVNHFATQYTETLVGSGAVTYQADRVELASGVTAGSSAKLAGLLQRQVAGGVPTSQISWDETIDFLFLFRDDRGGVATPDRRATFWINENTSTEPKAGSTDGFQIEYFRNNANMTFYTRGASTVSSNAIAKPNPNELTRLRIRHNPGVSMQLFVNNAVDPSVEVTTLTSIPSGNETARFIMLAENPGAAANMRLWMYHAISVQEWV